MTFFFPKLDGKVNSFKSLFFAACKNVLLTMDRLGCANEKHSLYKNMILRIIVMKIRFEWILLMKFLLVK